MDDKTMQPLLQHMLCLDLYAANQAVHRVYKPLLAPLGLTYLQDLVMVGLWERDPLSVSEIGTRLGLESNTLTPMLKRMEAAGLITRRRDPGDERRVNISLTAEGDKMRAAAGEIQRCLMEATGRSEAELLRFQEDLRGLIGNVKRAAEDG